MFEIITLHSALPEVAAGAVPEWLHLVPSGSFRGKDGRGPWRLVDAGAVILASMADGKLPLDENHSIDLAAPRGEPSPARGWIVELQSRADGIWGRVEWNDVGIQLMTSKAYSGVSPALVFDKGSDMVKRILRASLTNTPNLKDLPSLHHQQDTEMDLIKLRAALGLPETADEAAILARVSANVSAVSLHSAQIVAIATAAGAKATDPAGLVVELQSVRAAAGSADRMAAELVALQSQVHTLKETSARARAEEFVGAAVKGGKPIPGVLIPHFVTRHMADPAAVELELNAMPSLHAGGLSTQQMVELNAAGKTADDMLSPEEEKVVAQMGLDRTKFIEHRNKQGKK